MFSEALNTKKQGDIGLGVAIGWFASKGYTVSLPLTDSQDYDLVVDIQDKLCRIQIKTTSFVRGDNFYVSLSVKGGNRSFAGKIKNFDKTKVDYIFILTSKNEKYLIPACDIDAVSGISLYTKYEKYIVR